MNSFEIITKKTNNPTKYKQNAKIEKSRKKIYAPFLTKYKQKVKRKPPKNTQRFIPQPGHYTQSTNPFKDLIIKTETQKGES